MTPIKAIKAKCYECTNRFGDGRKDCGIETCPLYNWMPYRKDKPKPKRVSAQIKTTKKST